MIRITIPDDYNIIVERENEDNGERDVQFFHCSTGYIKIHLPTKSIATDDIPAGVSVNWQKRY